MKKISLSSEFVYAASIVILALGVTLLVKADLGMSMVVAPAYLISLKADFLTFGMSEYLLQALLLTAMCLILRRFRFQYWLSFGTALLYGCVLDLLGLAFDAFTPASMFVRIVCWALGVSVSSFAIALCLRTYLPPQAYEQFVKNISAKYRVPLPRFKQGFDLGCLLTAAALSFLLFGGIRGLSWGTILCALVNGPLIGLIGRFLDARCDITPRYPAAEHWFTGQRTGKDSVSRR